MTSPHGQFRPSRNPRPGRSTRATANAHPGRYGGGAFDGPYPDRPRQKCDLSIANEGSTLFVESKLLRILDDNGKPNDNLLMHILSPYPQHRSALTDCEKLRHSGFVGRKTILIFGYERGRLATGACHYRVRGVRP